MTPDWLRRELEVAAAEVASWPKAKQDAMRRQAEYRYTPDPCPCPSRCNEAQTCVGLCAFNATPRSAP